MAVDGRKIRQSLCQGSDIEHDFPCSPCSKIGKNVAAIKHCVECDENLCQNCMDDHNKFSSMKVHQLLDIVKKPSGPQQELPSQRCEKHGGKLIDVYCPGHDTVCCSTCISVEHSGCKGIIFIPDIACKTDTSQKLKLLVTEINTLQARLHAFKQNKQEELGNAKKEKCKLIEEIKSERKKINFRLDKMEKELLQEADAIFQIKLQHIESNMKEIDARIAVLQESLQKINSAKYENESEKYVQIKRVNEERKTASDCLKHIERPSKTGKLRFDPYQSDSECNTIGSILHLPAIEVEKCFREFNVQVADDHDICNISDMCMSKNGCILMVDYNNKQIKKMNSSFQVISSLKVPSNPACICEINSSMLAITLLEGKVLFISQEHPMKVTNSFKVSGICRGIGYNNGVIYVCCGGWKGSPKVEGPGQIKVFSISGVFRYELSYHGGIEWPRRMAFSSSSKGFFVIDGYKGIIHIDNNRGVSTNVAKRVSDSSCICKINKNLFCVALTSRNLLLMSHEGKEQVVIPIKHADKENLQGMCFDTKT